MQAMKRKVLEAAQFIKKRIGQRPEIGFLTGTGLGGSAASLQIDAAFDYREIPHFPVSTVESHRGRFVFGKMEGRPLAVMQGRQHLYEGYSPLEVVFPVRVMRELGVATLIVSNAAGGLNLDFEAGDIMLISDHINLTGCNPLRGPNEESWGIRFPDMSAVYDKALAAAAVTAAGELQTPLRRGVYAGLQGPSLETPAETRFLRMIGADAVGFSTIAEVIAGVHAGMKVLGLSTITNINDPDHPVAATVEDVITVAGAAAFRLESIVCRVVAGL